jgi:multicomponent Na+:H+ antiporter subunit G
MNPDTAGWNAIIDGVSAVFLVVGALMSLAAAIGLLRFPDLLSRMHSAAKPQVLGLFLLLAAVGLQMRTWWVWPVLLVAWIFQLLTVPVSAHMVGRAGYRTKHLHRELLSTDELEAVVQTAAREAGDDGRFDAAAAVDGLHLDGGSPDGGSPDGVRPDGARRDGARRPD